MIKQDIPEDLFVFVNAPAFQPVRYQHVKRGTFYTVISDGEFHLNTFSVEGSIHEFPYQGRMVDCTMQFSGDGSANNQYAGPITIYLGDDGKFWLRPSFEFHDGRFTLVEIAQ